MLLIVMVAEPVFDSVIVCAALDIPVSWLGYTRLVGARLATGWVVTTRNTVTVDVTVPLVPLRVSV